ncbi:MAG: IPExxxVDY family protein [Candidatus Babeliaceae bacterium]|nr:IPExxxVDY family protein [Candidatus Babeliaceae bacterium]
MPAHKLVLDEVFEKPFRLMAIHSSVEEYKLAFLLNKHLDLKLARSRKDVDFQVGAMQVLFALYTFEDLQQYRNYHLVSNVAKGEQVANATSNSLFGEEQVSFQKIYLLPEFKKVDFLLKIEDDSFPVSEEQLLKQIKEIPQITTAYSIDFHQIKSKENLIFD